MSRPSIAAVRYSFPGPRLSIRDLEARGLLESKAEVLEDFGFRHVHVRDGHPPYQHAVETCQRLLSEESLDPTSVDLLLWAGQGGAPAFASDPATVLCRASQRTSARFRFPATRLQHDLGLMRARVIGLDQLGCNGLFVAVQVAASLLATQGLERALCVGAEFFPVDAGREAVYNCASDAVVAVVVERDGTRNRIAGGAQVTKGFYWDPDQARQEMIAAYFPTALHVVRNALDRAGWAATEVDWVIPHNVSARSWEILQELLELPNARIWTRNIARRGHTISGDNFINLQDAVDAGHVRPGQRLVLFSFAYGAHWSALAVEA